MLHVLKTDSYLEMLKVYEDYAEAIKSKGELPTELLFMALILEQQKMIKQLTNLRNLLV
jgi:hypothetical protein